MIKNPVMFVVEVGSVVTTIDAIAKPSVFAWAITVWLWLTVIFANLAEAVAEGRGKAQAETLRRTKTETMARRLVNWPSSQAEEEVAAPSCGSVTTWSSRPARSSPATATSSRAWPASTSRRSPVSPLR